MNLRLLSCILAVCSFAAAQGRPAVKHIPGATSSSAYKLIAIDVKNTGYAPADVIAASGLQIGQDVTEENFKAATAKLGETGLFTNISYAYSYSSAGTTLTLELTDNTHLLPVRFENFVWYSDQDLVKKVHADIPLFDGKVPIDGSIVDQVANVLSGLVATYDPKLHATYLRAAPSPDSPGINAIVYSVSGLPIKVRKLTYEGANPALLPFLQAVANKVEGGEYLRSKLGFFAEMDARTVYLKHGYLKAEFGEPQPHVVAQGPDGPVVDVNLPVTEGAQYKPAAVDWSGNDLFPAEQLQSLIHLSKDKPVDAVQLQEDLRSVQKLYGTRGYIKAAVTPETEFNDAETSVAYKLWVKQGDLYRLGEVDIDGLDEKAKARLREEWHLREGEPFDRSYTEKFIHESARDLPPGIHWKITPHESVNESDKTVDITITYVPSG